MNTLLKIFSTRELATLFWFVIILISLHFNADIKKSLYNVFKIFFSKKIQIPLFSLFLYVCLITYLLQKIELWEINLLKDTILWFLFSALVLFFNTKTDEKGYFKKIIIDNLKLIIIVEFLVNFYTFSLITELIIIPIMTIIVMLQTYSNHSIRKEEHKQVASCLNNIISLIGLCLILYISYKTFFSNDDLFTISNLRSLLLPIIYTILTLPFFFLLALYMSYENLFIRIPYILDDKSKAKKLKLSIFMNANISLKNIRKINRELNWEINAHDFNTSIKEMIKK